MTQPRVTPQFLTEYKKLNTAQKQAVDTIEGPVMVIAGPGTGKTQILTLRIANILKQTDASPDAVLALTFTESGVAAMRRRLARTIGSAAYRVHMYTFHGFCHEVIRRFPDAFPRIIGGEPITDIDKIRIIRNIIDTHPFEQIKPFGNTFHYVNDIRQRIAEMKRENISPDALSASVMREQDTLANLPGLRHSKGVHAGTVKGKYQTRERLLTRTEELAVVYREYEAALRAERRYDFEDMIVEVVSALSTSQDLLLRLQEEYQYILADEHQDANAAQNKLLELLANFHEHPNLFIVGDEKQAIFRFQGASLENFLYFKRLYPRAVLITLTENYRSGQQILDAAHSMMCASVASEEEQALRTRLLSRVSAPGSLEVHAFSTEEAEHEWLVRSIRERTGEGVEPSEIAVLYRTNGEAEHIVRLCEHAGIPVSVESDQNALNDPDIRKFIVLLQATTHFGVDEWMATLLHIPFLGVRPLDTYKIIRYARMQQVLCADVLLSRAALCAAGVPADAAERIQSLAHTVESWSRRAGSVPETVSVIAQESGFLGWALGTRRAVELIEKLAGLMRDIESLATGNPDYSLRTLIEQLALLDEYRIPVNKEIRAAPRVGAVRLMTAHRAKGLEFEYVFVVHAVDGVWGGRKNRELFLVPTGGVRGEDDDERRLLYVALTRGKTSVALSYSERRAGGALLPSRFLEEIAPETYEKQVHTESHDVVAQLTTPPPVLTPELPDTEFLNELFREQGLSVTALNNYLTCPWNYFYNNLIRVPKSPNAYAQYGVAVHAALQRFFNERTETPVESDRLIALFTESVRGLPLVRHEQEEMITRGIAHLSGWYTAWHATWPQNVRTEYRIQTQIPTPDGEPVSLRGVLDKIEFLDGSLVRVVDYKTGKPKTRSGIQGLIKSEDGSYWRQLVFYKMLLRGEGKYELHEAQIDFVQPDDKRRYHKETFSVTDKDVSELTETLFRVVREIRELSFWDTRCDDASCESCALRNMLQG